MNQFKRKYLLSTCSDSQSLLSHQLAQHSELQFQHTIGLQTY